MLYSPNMVVASIDRRKRLLDLIAVKVGEDKKMAFSLSRCMQWDSMLLTEVLAESLRVKAEEKLG